MSYTIIPDFPEYEINEKGSVRKKGGHPLAYKKRDSGNPFVTLKEVGGKVRSRSVNVLLYEVFGTGAATAAGFHEPNMARVQVQRELAKRPRSGKSLGEDAFLGPTRRCHDCGEPTSNYRCDNCWIELRGFGMNETSRYNTHRYEDKL